MLWTARLPASMAGSVQGRTISSLSRPHQRIPEGSETPEQQQLITDLFEKITLYDLKVTDAVTRKDSTGWTTTLTVAADKYYANGKGVEAKAALQEPIEIGLFTARPGLGAFSAKDVIAFEQKPISQRHSENNDPHVSKARIRGRRSV